MKIARKQLHSIGAMSFLTALEFLFLPKVSNYLHPVIFSPFPVLIVEGKILLYVPAAKKVQLLVSFSATFGESGVLSLSFLYVKSGKDQQLNIAIP